MIPKTQKFLKRQHEEDGDVLQRQFLRCLLNYRFSNIDAQIILKSGLY